MDEKNGSWRTTVRRDDIVSSVQKMLGDDPDRVTTFSGRIPGKSWLQAFLSMYKFELKKPGRYRAYIKIKTIGNGALHQGMVRQTTTKFYEPTSHQPHRFRLVTEKKLKHPTMSLLYCSTQSSADFTKQK